MRLTLFISLLLFPLLSQAIECVGYYEFYNAQTNKVEVESVPLQVEIQTPATLKLSADIGDYHYMALGQVQSDNYLLMVTLGPEYTSGVTAGLTWDQNNSMRVSRVDGNSVYKLVCNK